MVRTFTDINQSPSGVVGSILTTFDGVLLDGEHGFRTLNVTGRGLITPSISMTPRVGGDGAWLDNVRLQERVIRIEAMIDTNHDSYKWLNAILHSGLKVLSFSDEPSISYEAVFSGVSDYVDNRHRRIVTLTFVCPNPYKLGPIRTTASKIVSAFKYPVKPIKVTSSVIKAGNIVSIQTANSPSITLEGSVAVGDVYVIQWKEPLVTLNGSTVSQRLSIAQDFENMNWINNSTITSSQATLAIQYQEVGL